MSEEIKQTGSVKEALWKENDKYYVDIVNRRFFVLHKKNPGGDFVRTWRIVRDNDAVAVQNVALNARAI